MSRQEHPTWLSAEGPGDLMEENGHLDVMITPNASRSPSPMITPRGVRIHINFRSVCFPQPIDAFQSVDLATLLLEFARIRGVIKPI